MDISAGFELMHRELGNTIHFSVITIQVFPPSQNITILRTNFKIFLRMHFNHTMLFFKLADCYKISDTYKNLNNCPGHMLIT